MTPEEIKALRLKLGMTQAGFAYALKTTIATVSRWENGHSKPSTIWLREIKRIGVTHDAKL